MNPRDGVHQRVYRALLHLYPAAFRARFADELQQLFSDQLRDARSGGEPAGAVRTWLRTVSDLAVTAASEHARRDRSVAHSVAASPSHSSRALGLVGILGGVVLLAAFLVDIAPSINVIRILLFNLGSIAIVIGVHRRQSSAAPAVALAAAVPAVLANAWYLAMVILATWEPRPFAGDFGLVWFYAGVAISLTDAWFGVVTWRLGVVARWGALALAIGSLLALTGIDRLALTSESNPTIFGPLSQAGIVLGGIGWILLGIDVAIRRRAAEVQLR